MSQSGGQNPPATSTDRCPCGTGESYGACCQPLHLGLAPAATAVALMRSRFSAFALLNTAYLQESWHSSTRPPHLELDDGRRWRFLEILDTQRGGLLDTDGIVEFRAHYRDAEGTRDSLHERSTFTKESGRWRYVDGVFTD